MMMFRLVHQASMSWSFSSLVSSLRSTSYTISCIIRKRFFGDRFQKLKIGCNVQSLEIGFRAP
eukprot:scaffold7583_cov58-Attheya_sp.AAC.2